MANSSPSGDSEKARHCIPKLVAPAVLSACSVLLSALLLWRSPTIPYYVQYQASYSRSQAQLLYTKAKRTLQQVYWREILENVGHRQFNLAWNRVWNGPGVVRGIATDLNSNVVAFVKCRKGEGFWITVLEHNERKVAELRPSAPF